MTIDDYIAGFAEEPGYLDYARVGPLAPRRRRGDARAHRRCSQRARLRQPRRASREQDARVRAARRRAHRLPPPTRSCSSRTRARASCTPCSASPAACCSRPASSRACRSRPCARTRRCTSVQPVWLETDHGRVTPGQIREQLDVERRRRRGEPRRLPHRLPRATSRASARSSATGCSSSTRSRASASSTRRTRLADVVVVRRAEVVPRRLGHRLPGAVSDRALEQLTPVFSGFTGTEEDEPLGRGAAARARRARLPRVATPTRIAAGAVRRGARGDRRGRRRRDQRRDRRATSAG